MGPGPTHKEAETRPRMYERVNHRARNREGKVRVCYSGSATKPEAITLSRSTCSTTTTSTRTRTRMERRNRDTSSTFPHGSGVPFTRGARETDNCYSGSCQENSFHEHDLADLSLATSLESFLVFLEGSDNELIDEDGVLVLINSLLNWRNSPEYILQYQELLAFIQFHIQNVWLEMSSIYKRR